MVGCEGGFALLAVSPCLDVLVAHHLNCDIAFIDSTTLSCRVSSYRPRQLCMACSRLEYHGESKTFLRTVI